MIKKIARITTFLLLNFCFSILAIAQTNFATIKVDELSDAQIIQIMKQAEASGATTVAQLEQMAVAKGMKAEEIQKFKLRAEKLKSQGSDVQTASKPVATGREHSETTEGGSVTNEKKETNVGIPIFGSSLFANGNITFEPNLRIATPKGYVIGPDDKLIIDLTGDNEVNYNISVNTEGAINIPYVGRIMVAGLTIDQASSKIRAVMRGTYPAIASGRTSLAITLGNIRSIKVTITGQVTKPGTYTLSSLSSVYNALYASGGPNSIGSFRNIQLIRNNKLITTIDVYDFILKGIKKNDIRLEDQDVINIPVYQKRVEISGEVKQAAQFELVNGETLQKAIDFAGGYTTLAYTAKIKAFQNTERERKIIDIDKAQIATYIPSNGDKFIVEAILERFENKVEIIGSVFRPGVYELEKGLTLKGLIQKAEGLTEDAFMYRGYILRLNLDNTSSLESFDISAIMSGKQADIPLRREDKITISSIFDLKEEYKIIVQGEVRMPNELPYSESMSIEDAIQMAGGFKEGATPKRVEVSRRIRNSNVASSTAKTSEVYIINVDRNLKLVSDSVFKLQPFDIITVRTDEGYLVQKQVTIEGEVLYPGIYTITNRNERISDLIKRAGGLTALAYTDGASLKRPGRQSSLFTSQRDANLEKEAEYRKKAEQERIKNLQRISVAGADTTVYSKQAEIISSDMVGIELTRILKAPGKPYDLLLEDGDVIKVPKQLQTIKVSGEVLSPNNIVFRSGKSFKSYITGAGGFTANALRGSSYVKYANGAVDGVRGFLIFRNYPKMVPGAEILVPKRPERERLTAQSWIGIGTAVASVGAVIVSLLR